jgi:hypothetical protein
MTDGQHFSGEDENAGFASPVQDLIAAAFLALLSLWVMIESLRLDIPGSLTTAPGLLPFLTAASLCAMAAYLASMAIRRHRNRDATVPLDEKPDHLRTVVLFCLIGAYLICVQLINFEYTFQLGSMRLGYGAFEVLTIIALTTILSVFWRQALWSCLAVSIVWVTLLAGVFRYVFTIPLPGSV